MIEIEIACFFCGTQFVFPWHYINFLINREEWDSDRQWFYECAVKIGYINCPECGKRIFLRHDDSGWTSGIKKTDGTYLYFFTKELNLVTGFKITSDDFSVIGMAYVNGLYTVIGTTNLHETKVWQTANIFDHGIFGQTIEVSSIAKAMATGNNNICLLSNNVQGTVVKKSLITLT